ncbi:MAG: PD-(D/E)XK nuclease family protein [Bacteroidales bacterium]|nr:PD-(D/E)XK nuclease family protein [Bacteroidales bacterium]
MIEANNINILIERISSLYQRLYTDINAIMNNENISSFTQEYRRHNNANTELGFNIFKIVSDTYYKENFHSDVLLELLNPKSKHKQGQKILDLFVERLTKLRVSISKENYQDSEVVREKGRIDLLIYDKESSHCIIIENKINNAVDMERQIPRYVEYCLERSLIIDCIIYLPLDATKTPNNRDWTDQDIKLIDPILHIVPAYNDCQNDLVNLFLNEILNITTITDIKVLVEHYIKLIKYLRKQVMNKPIFNSFLEEMKLGNNYQTAISISEMLNEFPNYLAIKIKDDYEIKGLAPFKRIWMYKGNVPVFDDFIFKDCQISMDIWWERDNATISLFHRHAVDINSKGNILLKSISEVNLLKLNENNQRWERVFILMDEYELLYEAVDAILVSLSERNI